MGTGCSTPRRIVTRLLVFLLLGAIVNVGLAWGIAVQSPPYDYRVGGARLDFETGRHPTLTAVHASRERILVYQEIKDWPGIVMPIWNESTTALVPSWSRILPTQRASILGTQLNGGAVKRLEEQATGWPVLSLRSWRATDGAWSGTRTLASDGTLIVPVTRYLIPTERVLPCRPIWPGFAINTISYAAALWMMSFVPGVLRRKRRRRRGLCIHCGYDLRGSPPDSPNCPECGEPIDHVRPVE